MPAGEPGSHALPRFRMNSGESASPGTKLAREDGTIWQKQTNYNSIKMPALNSGNRATKLPIGLGLAHFRSLAAKVKKQWCAAGPKSGGCLRPVKAESLRRLLKVLSRSRQNEFAVFNTPHGQHMVREVFDRIAAAFHDDYFEAVVGVEVNVSGCQNISVGVMLNLIEFV